MSANRSIMSIPLKNIVLGDNSRQTFNEIAMSELMVSMKQTGLLQPVGVKTLGGNKYKLVFGFRRHQGAEKLGWEVIDAVVVEAKTDEEEYIKNSIENIHRTEVPYAQQGRIFAGLVKKGLTSDQIAARVGCNKRYVQDVLEAYRRIPMKYQEKIAAGGRGSSKATGHITPTTAFAVLNVQKTNSLSPAQTEQLFEYAKKAKVSTQHLNVVGTMLRSKVPLKAALDKVEITRILTFQIAMEIPTINRLRGKYKKSIHSIIYEKLAECKELKFTPMRSRREIKEKDELPRLDIPTCQCE